jgi:hypothetical protein
MPGLDTLPEFIVAGLVLLGALAIILLFLRWALQHGAKLRAAGASLSLGDGYAQILAKLDEMDKERAAAQNVAIKREQLSQTQWKRNFGILDGIVTALHESGIGNGNLKEAQRLLAECEDARDEALLEQIGS